MKFSIRDLLLVTVIVALAGCMIEEGGSGSGGNVKNDKIQYFPPGPEFEQSRAAAKAKALAADNLPNSSAPA